MTSQRPEAIAAALALLQDPRLARSCQRAPLPKGITALLEIAAGESGTLAAAAAATSRSEETLRKAAGFFIEQVLLSRGTDSFRILGGDCETPEACLRRHMALLMRWVHPDLIWSHEPGQLFDRSVFAGRVTDAWESIKTADRRAAYGGSTAAAAQNGKASKPGMSGFPASGLHAGRARPGRGKRRQTQPTAYWLRGEGFWNRLLLLLGGRR